MFRATRPSLAEVIQVSAQDVHPPGYYLLLHGATLAFGKTEMVVRGLSLAIGLLGAFAAYVLGRIVYGELAALFFVALLGTSQTFVAYAQEARMYMPMLTAIVLSTACGLTVLRRPLAETRCASIGLTLSATIAAYSHYVALLYLALLALWFFVAARHQRPLLLRLLWIWLGAAVLYAPWIPELFRDLTGTKPWIPRPEWSEWKTYAQFVLGKNSVWLHAALAALGLAYGLTRSERGVRFSSFLERDLPSVLLVIVPFLVLMVVSRISANGGSIYVTRVLIASLPFAALLAARGAAALATLGGRYLGHATRVAPLLLVAFLSWRALSAKVYRKPVHEQFREVAGKVIAEAAEEDPVIVASAWNPFYFDYYFELLGSPLRVDAGASEPKHSKKVGSLLRKNSGCQAFYIYGHRKLHPAILSEFADNGYRKTASEKLHGAGFFQFARRGCSTEHRKE